MSAGLDSFAWPTRARRGGLVGISLLAWLLAPAAAQQPMGDLVDRTSLRVCADPSNLPFSDQEGAGFENKIAGLVADHLGRPVTYTWYPRSMGFVRNTLRANRCDVVMGVVSADEMVQNTNPYYRSTYVLAHRTEDGARYASLDSPAMKTARIGVISATPPADLLRRHKLLGRIESYNLVVDTRVEHPGREMMADLGAGRIDVALLWGPIAGYFAAQQPVPITLEPLESDVPGLRLDFRISMGVRSGETDWKHQLNGVIRDLKPEIDRILADYHVPLLNAQGQLIGATPTQDHAATRADPAGSPRTGSGQ